MIEIRKHNDEYELIIWTDEDSGVIQKLKPRDIITLKAKLDVESELIKVREREE